jgi:L-asparagine transporter-like permease
MPDYVDDYLKKSDKPMSSTLRMLLKLAALGFVSAAVTDLLKTHTAVQGRMAELVGLLSGVLVQQIIPPRLSAVKLILVSVGICAVMGILFFLHL